MSPVPAAAGWVAAAGAGLVAAGARRDRNRRLELVAEACHELRGPLTAARLGLSGHGRTPALEAVDFELDRANLALVDLAAAREGRRAPDPYAPVELGELAASVVRGWTAYAAARGARLETVPAGAEVLVLGARLRLAQAVGNLVANAVEHGGGEVAVVVRGDGSRARVEVSDGGPGLPAPVEALVRARRRGAPLRTHGHGLAIAREVARRHGGTLAAAPSGSGARLVLELPALP